MVPERYLKQLFNSKANIYNHISIFSLIGIMTLCVVKINAKWLNFLCENCYFSVHDAKIENIGLLLLSILIIIFLI